MSKFNYSYTVSRLRPAGTYSHTRNVSCTLEVTQIKQQSSKSTAQLLQLRRSEEDHVQLTFPAQSKLPYELRVCFASVRGWLGMSFDAGKGDQRPLVPQRKSTYSPQTQQTNGERLEHVHKAPTATFSDCAFLSIASAQSSATASSTLHSPKCEAAMRSQRM